MSTEFLVETLDGEAFELYPKEGEGQFRQAVGTTALQPLLEQCALERGVISELGRQVHERNAIDKAFLSTETESISEEVDMIYNAWIAQQELDYDFETGSIKDESVEWVLSEEESAIIALGMDLPMLDKHGYLAPSTYVDDMNFDTPLQSIVRPKSGNYWRRKFSEDTAAFAESVRAFIEEPIATHYLLQHPIKREADGSIADISQKQYVVLGNTDVHGEFLPRITILEPYFDWQHFLEID